MSDKSADSEETDRWLLEEAEQEMARGRRERAERRVALKRASLEREERANRARALAQRFPRHPWREFREPLLPKPKP